METNNESPNTGKHGHSRRRWIGAALVVGTIIGVIASNAYSRQSGTGSMCSTWSAHRGSHALFGAKDARQHAEFVVDRIMSEVKADDAQKLKARGIADSAASDLQQLAAQHHESHKELVAILSAPTLDRTKLEALRSKTARSVDESSKRITVAVADLAELLTPAQRLQLVDRIEKRD